jgi:predicted ABC-type ATPase
MTAPRLRLVAGPNGSGKSTLLDWLEQQDFPLGHCFNPDAVEANLIRTGRFDFGAWDLKVDQLTFRRFVTSHALASRLRGIKYSIHNNVLTARAIAGGYFLVVLGDFLRRAWVRTGQTFTFETVMSARNKVQLLRGALNKGYRTYLYYLCTENVMINLARVANRKRQGGHDVLPEKILQRYQRSLRLLPRAIQFSSRAYIFDNSGKTNTLIAEYQDGKLIRISKKLPAWFIKAVLTRRDLGDG